MAFSVPLLLEVSLAVIHRLDPMATKVLEPYTGATSGYDKDFREAVTFDRDQDDVPTRSHARVEQPAIRVPCQVEPVRFDQLKQIFSGTTPDSEWQLVFHRADLRRMGLVDRETGMPKIKVNDRVERIEARARPGKATLSFAEPGLYIYEIRPGSFGFGTDGYDLHIAFLHSHERGAD